MRFLEWLLCLSFVPVLLFPFIPKTSRRYWLRASAALPALVGGFHLLIEGWRVQMIPIYILAGMALASRLPAFSKPDGIFRRVPAKLLRVGAVLILVLCGVFAGWFMPVLTLPQPSGPYRVGIADRALLDQARGRRLMVSIWYPTLQSGPPAPLTHDPDAVAAGLGNLTGLPDLAFQHLRYTRLSASNVAPMPAEGGPFPVLVFSHGLVGLRLQNSSTLQELASWGYVVVALDHTDAAAVTVFPDGEARFYSLEPFGIPNGEAPDKDLITERVFPVWVADQRFVYDTLEAWAVDDALLGGKLDLERIGSFGHSFGGATSLEVCRIDPRCRAAANLDGGLYGAVVTQPAVRPFLLMTSAESSQLSYAVADWSGLVEHANAEAYWLEIPGSTHFSFTITQLLSPVLAPPNYDPRAGLRTIDRYTRRFFDLHLRGQAGLQMRPACKEADVRWRTESPCQ